VFTARYKLNLDVQFRLILDFEGSLCEMIKHYVANRRALFYMTTPITLH
jgi:hypothetical protein